MRVVNQILANYQTQERTFEGREYLVAPVVMLKEGVHNGSAGPLYYPPDVIKNSADRWENVPVTIPHPENDGELISVSDPGGDRFIAGHVRNVQTQDDELKAQVWLDIDRTNQINPAVIPAIRNHNPVEVSTGLGGAFEPEQGTWNNETYDAMVKDIAPDHLALLPGAVGACSWDDGCGIRNEEKGGFVKNIKDRILNQFGVILEKLGLTDIDNSASFGDIQTALQLLVDALDNDTYYHYINDVYDDYFIYRAMPREREERGIGSNAVSTLYKQGYSKIDDKVEFVGEPVEVIMTKEYKPVANDNSGQKIKNKQEDKKMACCEERVEALIKNEKTTFTEDDKEWLNNLDQEQYERVETTALRFHEVDNKVDEPEKKETVDNQDPATEDKKPITTEDYIKQAPPEIQSVLNESLALHNQKRQTLIEGLMANERNKFTKEQLEEMDTIQLEQIAALADIPVKANYAANSGGKVDGNGAGEPLVPPRIEPAKSK